MQFNILYINLIAIVFTFINPTYGQQKHLYIANQQHTDYVWTADAETYRLTFINQLDYYINLMETQNGSLSAPFQQRYNCDNLLWVYEYEKAKSPADFKRLIDQVKSGHISIPFNNLVPLYGGQSAEIAIRGMYYGGYLERKYGLDLDLVVTMENQTIPLGINSLWAGAGAKYSWKGVCNCLCPDLNFQNRKHEVYYSRGRDGKGILMKWYDFIASDQLGGYGELRFPREAINYLKAKCNTNKYPFDIAGAFGYGWDDLENYIGYLPELATAQSDSSQLVIVSNEKDFYEDFEGKYANAIPTQTVSFGNDWDVLVASMAKVSGDVKSRAEKLRTGEAIASIVALHDTGFAQNLAGQRELAWISLGKYYDHDWTDDGPVSIGRAQFQRDMEKIFSAYVDTLYNSAQTALGNQILKTGTNSRFYVFNQLSWSRTEVADYPYSGNLPIKIIDLVTQLEVPSQIITLNGVRHIRILASGIPAVGYKVFEIQPGTSADFPVAANFSNGVFENDFYKMSISENGSVTSFQDKSDGNYEYVKDSALNNFGRGTLNSGNYTLENAGPVSATVSCSSNSPYAHINRFTLYKSVERVDIDNLLNHNNGDSTVVYKFPFNINNSTVWHEEVGAVIMAKLESKGGHYSDQNARYDWQTANHFIHVGNPERGITISNIGPHFFKVGNSTIYFLDENSSNIQFLAGGKVAYRILGIDNQGGDNSFEYQFALHPKSGAFSQTASMKMSLEHQNPLTTGLVKGGNVYPETTFSLISISPEDVLLWSLKPSEEGAAQGLIARVWNQGNSSNLIIDGNIPILLAKNTSLVETDYGTVNLVNNNIVETIGSQEMKTFRIFFNNIPLDTNNIPDPDPRLDIFVYVDRSADVLNVLGNYLPNGRYLILLTNILGQTVFQNELDATDNRIEKHIGLSKISSGVYLLSIISDKTRQVFKIFK